MHPARLRCSSVTDAQTVMIGDADHPDATNVGTCFTAFLARGRAFLARWHPSARRRPRRLYGATRGATAGRYRSTGGGAGNPLE